VFFLGLLWAAVNMAAPSATLIVASLAQGRPVHWPTVGCAAASGALMGVGNFWRKNAALLRLPPWLEEAKALQAAAHAASLSQAAGKG
jgi:hypothetical protein